jgi:cytochrome b561
MDGKLLKEDAQSWATFMMVTMPPPFASTPKSVQDLSFIHNVTQIIGLDLCLAHIAQHLIMVINVTNNKRS